MPTFVYPGKKPSYPKDFEKSILMLESIDINNDDLCVMGNVRVNLTMLQAAAGSRKRVSVSAFFTTDNWETRKESKVNKMEYEFNRPKFYRV